MQITKRAKDFERRSSGGLSMPFVMGILLLVGAAAVCFWPLTSHPTGILVGTHDSGRNDLTCGFLAFRDMPRMVWAQARQVPFWNPYLLTGTPWYGNPQSALFYPPNWLFFVFPAPRIISWVLVLHHVWGGLGAMLLSRRYGCSWMAAVTTGITFLAAPYLIAHSGEGHYNQVCLIAWVPWAFLVWERLRERKPGSVALLAIILSLCFFCGHVQELYYLMVILSVLTLAGLFPAAFRGRSGGDSLSTPAREAGGRLARWGLVCLVVAGLTAIDLIPTWFYSRSAVRAAGLSAADASQFSLGPTSLLQLLDPHIWGGPESYRGPGGLYWETLCYFGVVPLLLAVAGSLIGWRRYPVMRFSLLAVLSVAFAFGQDLPVFSLMHRFVPGMSLFRAPSRALFFSSFAIAVLAGFGVDALMVQLVRFRSLALRTRRRLTSATTVVASAIILVGILANPGGSPDAGSPTVASALESAIPWLGGMIASLLLAAWWPKLQRGICALLAVLCVAELAVHAHEVLAVVDRSDLRAENPIARLLQQETKGDRVLAPQALLSDREAWPARLHKVHGYEPVPQLRAAALLAALMPQRRVPEVLGEDIQLGQFHKPLLDLLGVSMAATLGPPQSADGWRAIDRGTVSAEFHLTGGRHTQLTYTVYRNDSPLPRAFVLGDVSLLRPGDDTIRLLQQLDPRRSVLLDRDLLPPGPRQTFGPAEIQDYLPNEVTVLANLSSPGYLVLTDLFCGGWKAEVDGKPAPVLPADFAFRAVPLEAGRHLVRFRFEPVGARASLLISLLTALGLSWFTWRSVGRRRQTGPPQQHITASTSDYS